MADDNDDPFQGIGAGPQGFGGGSPTEEPQGNAIPEPAPASPNIQPGNSLQEDLGAFNPSDPNTPFNQLTTRYNQNAAIPPGGGLQAIVPKIMNYLTGGGGMSKQQWEQMNQQVDPQNTMDQNERTMRVIDAAQQQDPNMGAAALQAARKHYDIYRAGAAKSLTEGQIPNAIQQANNAFDYAPDGTKAQFTADKNGIISASVHSMDGQTNKFNMSTDQFHQLLRGQHGMFDHVVEQGADGVIQAITQAGGQQQKPQAGSDLTGPAPVGAVEKGAELPDNASYQTDTSGHKQLVPLGGKTVTDNEGRTHILGPGQELSAMTGAAYQDPRSQVVNHTTNEGSEPITVVRGGRSELWGNAKPGGDNTPEEIQAAREQFPNNVGAQSAYLAGQRQFRQKIAGQVEVAKNQRLYGNQAAAEGRVGAAQAAGQSRENVAGTNARSREAVATGQNQSRENVAGINAGAKKYAADTQAAWEQYRVDNPNQNATGLIQSEIKAMNEAAKVHPEWTEDQMDQFLTRRFGQKNWLNTKGILQKQVQGPTPAAPAQGEPQTAAPSAGQTAPRGESQSNAAAGAAEQTFTGAPGTKWEGKTFKRGPDGRPVLVGDVSGGGQ